MLGGLGDVLIALCIAKHYSERFGARTPFLTSAKHQNLLGACSYVESVGYSGAPWRGYREAITWARSRYAAVYPLHVGDADVQANLRTARFCHEQYLMGGVPGRYNDFPLVIDRRSPEREGALVARVRAKDPRPFLLYTLEGRSSPFVHSAALLDYLRARWGKQLALVNTSDLKLSHYHDLLGLLEASVGALTIDTSTIHLMPASDAPYIALLNDTKTPWWQSVPRGNCIAQLGYTHTMTSLEVVDKAIAGMLKRRGVTPQPEAAAQPVTVSGSAPHLVTLACGGMEKVWRMAARTWQPWREARGIALTTATRAPDESRHPSWNKLILVLEALEKHDVVWWIDSDITVARDDATLPESNTDLLFASDWNGLCAGMFRARATPWTKGFLRAALLLGDVCDPDAFGEGCGVKWEQNAFKALLREFPSVQGHVALLPPSFLTDRDWKAGDVSLASFNHFGGMSNSKRIAMMRTVHKL